MSRMVHISHAHARHIVANRQNRRRMFDITQCLARSRNIRPSGTAGLTRLHRAEIDRPCHLRQFQQKREIVELIVRQSPRPGDGADSIANRLAALALDGLCQRRALDLDNPACFGLRLGACNTVRDFDAYRSRRRAIAAVTDPQGAGIAPRRRRRLNEGDVRASRHRRRQNANRQRDQRCISNHASSPLIAILQPGDDRALREGVEQHIAAIVQIVDAQARRPMGVDLVPDVGVSDEITAEALIGIGIDVAVIQRGEHAVAVSSRQRNIEPRIWRIGDNHRAPQARYLRQALTNSRCKGRILVRLRIGIGHPAGNLQTLDQDVLLIADQLNPAHRRSIDVLHVTDRETVQKTRLRNQRTGDAFVKRRNPQPAARPLPFHR